MQATAARPTQSDSAHWYTASGEACYTQIAKSTGKPRPTTLADARKLSLVPSTTTILKCLHKQALVDWLIEQSCLAVLTTPRNEGEDLDSFVTRVLHTERVQDEESTKARELGTDMHNGLEALFRGEQIDDELRPWIEPAYLEVKRMCPLTIGVEAILVGDGYAGKCDFIGYAQTSELIIDFKSTRKLPAKESWTEHRWQLSSYAAARRKLTPRVIETGNLYISTVDCGKFVFHQNPPWKTDYELGFEPLRRVWCHLNNYYL